MGPCLSDEVIAAYVDHRLDPDERRRVETHLARCDRCLEQVALLRKVVADPDDLARTEVPAAVLARAEALFAERFGRTGSILDLIVRVARDVVTVLKTTGEVLAPQPAAVPLRGRRRAARTVRVEKRTHDRRLTVEVESRRENPVLRVMLQDEENEKPLHGTRVDLKGPAGSETRFTEHGLADFGPREPGRYRIRIEELGDVSLDIQSAP